MVDHAYLSVAVAKQGLMYHRLVACNRGGSSDHIWIACLVILPLSLLTASGFCWDSCSVPISSSKGQLRHPQHCLWACFPFLFHMNRLEFFHIFKFWLLFDEPFHLHIISFFSHFTFSGQEGPGHSFSSLFRDFLSQISDFFPWRFYHPQNTRMWTQFSQVLWHFITRIVFPPLSNNMLLISVWALIRMAFTTHISNKILFQITWIFPRKIEAFSKTLVFFLSFHQNCP